MTSPYYRGQGSSSRREDGNLLQDENEERLHHLHSKVAALKAITIDIGNEVKDQNKFLDSIGSEFDRAGSLITSTINRVKELTISQRGQNYLGYTIVFVILVFVFLYLWLL